MSTRPRLAPAGDATDADFGSVTAHAAPVMQRFFELYGSLWQTGQVADEVRELTRIRNARITDCGY